MTAASLYEELLRRCEQGETSDAPLYQACKLATSPEDARVVLNAFAAVRTAAVRKGQVGRVDAKLAAEFVRMIRAADAPEVLTEALRRATELGLVCSGQRVNDLLKVWGVRGELAKIEEVVAAMPLGGIEYSPDTAYAVIRTCVTLGQQDKAEYYAQAMRDRQVHITPSTERLLQRGREGTATPLQQAQ